MSEDFMDDAEDWMGDYMKNTPKENDHHNSHKNEPKTKGFEVVKGAPWQGASDEAFPTLGGPSGGGASVSTPVWGPRR